MLLASVCSFGQFLESTDSIEDVSVDNQAADMTIDLLDYFDVPNVDGQVVLLDMTWGVLAFEMLPNAAPKTVENFLKYVTDGDYDNSIFHRSVPGFIIQGGGFYATLPVTEVSKDPNVDNEFSLSNLRGTIAMAKLGGNQNSATNEWFINLANNSGNLDEQNGGFTVFARVMGTGMVLADAIATLPRYNLGGALNEAPMRRILDSQITEDDFVRFSTARKGDLFPVEESTPSFVSFSVSSSDDTIVTASMSGSDLQLNLGQYRTGMSTITVTAVDVNGNEVEMEFDVTLTQDGEDSTMIDLAAQLVSNASGSYDIAVDSNTIWEVSESLDWLTVSASDGAGPETITVNVEENMDTAARVGSITVGGVTHLIVQRGDFSTWLAGYFSTEEIAAMEPSAFGADSDGDGLSNGVEQALKTDPSDVMSKTGVRIQITESGRYLVYEPDAAGLTFGLKSTLDLLNWAVEEDAQGSAQNGAIWFSLPENGLYQIKVSSPLFENPVAE